MLAPRHGDGALSGRPPTLALAVDAALAWILGTQIEQRRIHRLPAQPPASTSGKDYGFERSRRRLAVAWPTRRRSTGYACRPRAQQTRRRWSGPTRAICVRARRPRNSSTFFGTRGWVRHRLRRRRPADRLDDDESGHTVDWHRRRLAGSTSTDWRPDGPDGDYARWPKPWLPTTRSATATGPSGITTPLCAAGQLATGGGRGRSDSPGPTPPLSSTAPPNFRRYLLRSADTRRLSCILFTSGLVAGFRPLSSVRCSTSPQPDHTKLQIGREELSSIPDIPLGESPSRGHNDSRATEAPAMCAAEQPLLGGAPGPGAEPGRVIRCTEANGAAARLRSPASSPLLGVSIVAGGSDPGQADDPTAWSPLA